MLKVIHRCLYNTRVSIFDFAQTALLNYLMVDKTAWTHFVRILTDFPHLLTILMYFDSQSFPRRKITFFKIKTAKGRGGKVQRISLRLDKIYQIPPQGSVIILWHPPSPPRSLVVNFLQSPLDTLLATNDSPSVFPETIWSPKNHTSPSPSLQMIIMTGAFVKGNFGKRKQTMLLKSPIY